MRSSSMTAGLARLAGESVNPAARSSSRERTVMPHAARLRRAETEPRQLIPSEVAVASIGALRTDRLGVEIGHEDAQHAVDMRQIGPVLIKLALQLINDAGEFTPLLDKTGDDVILARGHAALWCQ